ncbi:MAG: Gfo/Idh/MocA family oxidoreductase [Desulfobulbaceae bacterium]|nr:Gfo/Idh/MocA family oxidoreductase [Desulfobulbaceae bacterium]HIJ79819.1 Gfo/Idh/MocA family oxidoreductase [Deltaproteobacteria bacterium]
MDKIKLGVIGVGYLGKFHARKYAAMADVDLVGVADTNPDFAAAVAKDCNTKPFADFSELLKEVDAVSVVAPTSLHHQIGRICLEAGVDVMMEKPMTTTLEEADDLIAIAAAKKLIIQVGHIERYNPAVLAMAEHLTQPIFIESHRIHEFKPRGIDVDVVLDLMIHDIDIILSVVNSPIRTIHTVGVPVFTPTTDIANARLIFENGCTANITVSRISKGNQRRLRIFQPKSYISLDYGKKEIMVIKLTGEVDENLIPREEVIKSCFIEKDALEMELADFVNNVRNRTTPKVCGNQGRLALAVAQEIMAQIKCHAEQHRQLLQD